VGKVKIKKQKIRENQNLKVNIQKATQNSQKGKTGRTVSPAGPVLIF